MAKQDDSVLESVVTEAGITSPSRLGLALPLRKAIIMLAAVTCEKSINLKRRYKGVFDCFGIWPLSEAPIFAGPADPKATLADLWRRGMRTQNETDDLSKWLSPEQFAIVRNNHERQRRASYPALAITPGRAGFYLEDRTFRPEIDDEDDICWETSRGTGEILVPVYATTETRDINLITIPILSLKKLSRVEEIIILKRAVYTETTPMARLPMFLKLLVLLLGERGLPGAITITCPDNCTATLFVNLLNPYSNTYLALEVLDAQGHRTQSGVRMSVKTTSGGAHIAGSGLYSQSATPIHFYGLIPGISYDVQVFWRMVYPFQFKMSEGSVFRNGYLLVPSGTLLRKEYTGSSFFRTF